MRRMIVIAVLAVAVAGCTTGGTKVQSTWKDPEFHQQLHGPVLVLARLTEPGARRAIEDQTVGELRKRGIEAKPAYRALPEMTMNDPAVMEQARAAGAGAVMLYTMGGQYTDIANRPGVTPGVGIGPIGVGVGPVIGGSKAEQRSAVDVQLFPAGAAQPIWAAHYDINLKDGLQQGIADVPSKAATQARLDKVL